MQEVKIYDTTLRDGTQAEDFNLSLSDKIRIALKLDEFGIHYIEGGWPASNPKDRGFFEEIRNYQFKQAQIAAFGATHHPMKTPVNDANLKELLKAQTPVVTIFGKSWTVHVKDALHTTLERNLEIIRDSLAYLRPQAKTLFYDAEHFFDGFRADRDYALATLEKAVEGGAECLVLCDTNGGNLPGAIREIMAVVKERFPGMPLGIHAHNDADLAVAVNRLRERQGGSVIYVDGDLKAEIPLRVGGYASELEMPELADRLERFQKTTASLGSSLSFAHLTLSVLTTPAIPFIRMTETGYHRFRENDVVGLRSA